MDVDETNFSPAIVADVKQALEKSDFFSIDLEMSGISFNDVRAPHGTDSIALRYHKCREVAKTFGIIQVGLATFAADGSCRAWNFFVFPRPVTEGSVKSIPIIGLCSSGINFGRSTNIDFQRWIDKGVTFVNRNVEEQLASQESQPGWWTQINPNAPPTELTGKMQDLVVKELEAIEEFIADNSRVEYKISNMRSGAAVRQLLQQVTDAYPYLNVVEQKSGAATDRYLTKKSTDEIVGDRLGFRQIWKILTSSGKPLILHNGLLDLLFLIQSFEIDLPESVIDFKQSVSQLFPGGVYDTRLISLEASSTIFPSVHSGNFSAALESLVEVVRQDEAFTSIVLDPVSAAKYQGSATTYHEAAYDAFVTGGVFKAIVARLGGIDNVKAWVNTLCVARCYWAFSITTDSDRLLKDGGTLNKVKTVRYICGLNAGISTRDVTAIFEELQSSMTMITCKCFVDWIDDVSTLLIVTWSPVDASSDRDSIAAQLSAKLVELIKTAQKAGLASLRICSVDEFIRKQIEFADNGLSDEPAELQPIIKRMKRAQSTSIVEVSAEVAS